MFHLCACACVIDPENNDDGLFSDRHDVSALLLGLGLGLGLGFRV